MVSNLGVRSVHATVHLAVQYYAPTDPGPDSYIDQPRLVLARTPGCFAQFGRVRVVLDCHGHIKNALELVNQVLSCPASENVNVAELADYDIKRSRGYD